ncbi:nucleotidyltransferase family protein [Halovenus halobia]|uniref:nucleotidyltransferase family protein n=1 Tax=Halovenus halobia TaxID=3396622 RepID=UPI003F57F77B
MTVGAVLLAAGRSERFGGSNKLLAELAGRPLLSHAAQTVLDADLAGRVAVLGHEADAVRAALPDGFDTRRNDRFSEGQHTSVRAGVRAAREAGWDGAVFVLGDMPLVDSSTIDALVTAFQENRGTIVVPTVDGRRGNPVLFGAEHFDDLAAVTGDKGGRELVETHPDVARVAVADSGIHRDIDTPADLESVREEY